MGNCYLENVKNFATKKTNEVGLEMSAVIKVICRKQILIVSKILTNCITFVQIG